VEDIQIVPAGLQHADLAGGLMMETLYGFGVYQSGLGSAERGRKALGDYFSLPGNRFSYEYANIATVVGEPAALLLAFPGRLFGRLSRRTVWQMPRVYSLPEACEFFRRALILKDEEEVARDELYVAHLAVCAEFRRKGLARLLLDHAQKMALQYGLPKVSLLADLDNTGAIALYESYGFTTVKTYSHPHQIPLTGSPGYVKMIMNLSIKE
jgi:ribosomal protein S18 acetylase RimI-like enzyme